MKIDNTTAAVVTGGASGLGKASAQALAAAGATVAIFDVNVAGGEAVATEIGGVFCKVDITSEESVVAGFEKARAAHGQERVLVHCAMTSRRGKTLSFDKETHAYKRTSHGRLCVRRERHPGRELPDGVALGAGHGGHAGARRRRARRHHADRVGRGAGCADRTGDLRLGEGRRERARSADGARSDGHWASASIRSCPASLRRR